MTVWNARNTHRFIRATLHCTKKWQREMYVAAMLGVQGWAQYRELMAPAAMAVEEAAKVRQARKASHCFRKRHTAAVCIAASLPASVPLVLD